MDNRTLYLAFFVLAIYAIVVLTTITMCAVHSQDIVYGTWKCDSDGRVQKMLEQMLTFVGAFLAGKYSSGGK